MTPAAALKSALDVIERDQLAAYVSIADALAGLTIACEVDGDHFSVKGGRRLLIEVGEHSGADVRVSTRRAAILALIDGDLQLIEAVRMRDLRVVADISLMVQLSRAQRAFAEGAARARRVRPILDAFRLG